MTPDRYDDQHTRRPQRIEEGIQRRLNGRAFEAHVGTSATGEFAGHCDRVRGDRVDHVVSDPVATAFSLRRALGSLMMVVMPRAFSTAAVVARSVRRR